MKKYYIYKKYFDTNDATSKSREDTYRICEEKGYQKICVGKYSKSKIIKAINLVKYTFFVLKSFFMRKGILFSNFPDFYIRFFSKRILNHFKVVLLIHDIESIRLKNEKLKKKEYVWFSRAYRVLVHNTKMKEYLISIGIETEKIIIIGLFDYLEKNTILANKNYDLCFAGNLSKSKFIKTFDEFNPNITVSIFGNKTDMNLKNFSYMGSFPSTEINGNLNGKFGLVWDGDSIDTCAGNFGEYLKINNPFKINSYIIAEIPIIVWSEAASVEWIDEYKIGIVIDSLTEIEKKIKSVTKNEYESYVSNIKKVKNEITEGKHLKKCLNEVEVSLYDKKQKNY